jgi:hypothetical protein
VGAHDIGEVPVGDRGGDDRGGEDAEDRDGLETFGSCLLLVENQRYASSYWLSWGRVVGFGGGREWRDRHL